MTTAQNKVLYERDFTYIPRIAAVHDMCGYGKCSLGVAIPVLSCAGCDCCPAPTGLFSSHTKYPKFYMHDTTEMLDDYISAWTEAHVELDAIYSGFLGHKDQVGAIQRLYSMYPSALRIVDPVMGDNGKIYPTYTPELCDAMRELVDGADLLTPNITEACYLTDTEYTGQNITDDQAREILNRLLNLGAHYIILKGVQTEDGHLVNYIAGKDIEISTTSVEKLPFMLHGTGDLYCSSVLSAVMCGRDLHSATLFANEFVLEAMKSTQNQPDFEMRGVQFENVLGKVTELVHH